jgi:hypothetical protein
VGRCGLEFDDDERESDIMAAILMHVADKIISERYAMSLSAVKLRRRRAGIKLNRGQKPGSPGNPGKRRAYTRMHPDDVAYEPIIPPADRPRLAYERKAESLGMDTGTFTSQWLPGRTGQAWAVSMGFR